MAYNFNKVINVPNFQILIDDDANYGYFEHLEFGDECAGGLWFDGMELIDYDGVYQLPKAVRNILKSLGYTGDSLED